MTKKCGYENSQLWCPISRHEGAPFCTMRVPHVTPWGCPILRYEGAPLYAMRDTYLSGRTLMLSFQSLYCGPGGEQKMTCITSLRPLMYCSICTLSQYHSWNSYLHGARTKQETIIISLYLTVTLLIYISAYCKYPFSISIHGSTTNIIINSYSIRIFSTSKLFKKCIK